MTDDFDKSKNNTRARFAQNGFFRNKYLSLFLKSIHPLPAVYYLMYKVLLFPINRLFF